MVVQIKGLVKRYGDNVAVDQMDLSIKEREIFGLLGPNGAGKTTVINAILNLINVDQGTIEVFGKDISKHELELKKEIGIVPQDIAIYNDLSALENVSFFGKLYGLKGPTLKERALQSLEFTGLKDKRHDFPAKFSGGMKRRLNIACAIVHQPRLIIMDEPTVGIDPQSRNHILQSVRKLNDAGATVIYTSHYMEEVEELCSRIAIMDHGRIIAQGTKDELTALISDEEKVTIEVGAANFTILETVRQISGVKDCSLQENQLTVVSKRNSHNLGRIIDSLSSLGTDMQSVSIDKPTLEGVFLTLTGRSLRD